MFEKSIFCVVATLASLFFSGSSSFLQVTRITTISRMSLNFNQIRPLTAELSALECLKNQYLSRLVGKPTMWVSNRSDTNQSVQAQKRARSLKFWSEVEKELYYPSSENKGADQLCGSREADLRLCFRICRLLVFS